jgi:hypothetical protein
VTRSSAQQGDERQSVQPRLATCAHAGLSLPCPSALRRIRRLQADAAARRDASHISTSATAKWEHEYRVAVETLNNADWRLDVDLAGMA